MFSSYWFFIRRFSWSVFHDVPIGQAQWPEGFISNGQWFVKKGFPMAIYGKPLKTNIFISNFPMAQHSNPRKPLMFSSNPAPSRCRWMSLMMKECNVPCSEILAVTATTGRSARSSRGDDGFCWENHWKSPRKMVIWVEYNWNITEIYPKRQWLRVCELEMLARLVPWFTYEKSWFSGRNCYIPEGRKEKHPQSGLFHLGDLLTIMQPA